MLHYRAGSTILSEDLQFQTESGKLPVHSANWEYVVNSTEWEELE